MADIRVLYINGDSLKQEHSEASDSIKMASFKTANYELTDTDLGKLVGGGEADNHTHDDRYYREDEHIDSSVGVADGSKPIITDATGKIDNSLLKVGELNQELDHGQLQGLADDDHVQYLKTDGTRDVTGVMKYSTLVALNDDKDLVHKKFVTDLVAGQEWFDSAITRVIDPSTITPANGDRYLVDSSLGTALGDFAGQENKVAIKTATGWDFQTPTTGTYISVDDEDGRIFLFTGTTWDAKEFESTTASLGLVKVGKDIRVDSALAGDGLGFNSGVMNVKVKAGVLEVNADEVGIAADGVNATMIDYGTGANQVNASQLPIVDTRDLFTGSTVENALEQLADNILALGVSYNAGSTGVNKGDLIYITGNDVVSKLSNLTLGEFCVGLASETKASGQAVKALQNDTVIKNVLTGAVAGTKYFWNGTGYTSVMPTTAGSNVWQVGVAKNATDLHIEVKHIKKNA